MLRFLFWSLLLANGALAAYQLGYLDTVLPNGHEPTRLEQQIAPERIRLVPPPAPVENPGTAAEPGTPTPASSSSPATPNPASPTNAVADQVALASVPETLACVEAGNFNPADAKRFLSRLGELGERATRRPVQEVASHMVFMPPQGDRDGAEKKADELRRLGVTDFFIIQDNSNLRWGLSLGVFKTEEAANGYLASLGQKGVRSARVVRRNVASNQVAFQFRDLDGRGKGILDAAQASLGRQVIRECAAPA